MAEVANSCNVLSCSQSGEISGEGVDAVVDVDLVRVIGILDAFKLSRDYCAFVKVT